MVHLRKIGKFIIPVLMVIVVYFVANATSNQHYHKLSSGLIVKHAHPYEKGKIGNPFQEHHHTSSEFFLLDHLYNIVYWICLLVFSITQCLSAGEILNFSFHITHKKYDLYFLKNYHAPPDTSY